ncbi:L10-interacting MYB domain-containing protein [Bienertia sinuspersici]
MIFLYILGHNGTKEEKKVHFHWLKNMSKELLEFLAEEVRKGNTPNNTFRTSSFVVAAKVISEKFQVNCTTEHVENHMKTVRNSWATISIIRNNYRFGNIQHKNLNRKIDLYDEMAIVVGKDMARGNFSKTFGDIDVDATIKVANLRSCNDEEGCDMGRISDQLQVVSALKSFSNNQLNVEKLYEEIMKMDDIEEAVRVAAFEHLVEHSMLAKAFLTKSTHLCKLWFEKFVKSLP